ncbi:MAG: DUF3037 domain-containing protein [bacterium]
MSTQRGFYSVIQFCPDSYRAESANVGAVLYVPATGYLAARWSPDFERVKRFFRLDADGMVRVAAAVRALDHRLQIMKAEGVSEAGLSKFIATRADQVQLTPLRLVMVEQAAATLDELFTDAMDENATTVPRQRRRAIVPEAISRAFEALRARNDLIEPGNVLVPGLKSTLRVPYAFRNGKLNLVKPENLDDAAQAENKVGLLGFKGRLLFTHPEGDLRRQLVIVSAGRSPDADAEQQYKASLASCDVRFVPAAEAAAFAAEVEATAH